MSSLQLPSAIVTSLEHIRIYKYLQVSSVALLLFDYNVTFEREVELIWRRKWTYVTLIFIITRYLPFVDSALTLFEEIAANPAPSTCKVVFNIQSWLYVFGISVAAGILILRTYAIWNNKASVAWGLIVLLVGAFTGTGFFLQQFLNSLVLSTSPSPEAFPGCFVMKASQILWLAYLFILIFETSVFGMTLYKSISQGRFKSSALARTIYRDGVAFYGYLLCVSIVNIVVLNAAPPELKTGLTGLHRVLHAILSERIILNIRSAAESKRQGSSGPDLDTLETEESHTLKDLEFAEPRAARIETIMSTVDVSGIQSSSSSRGWTEIEHI